MEDVRWKKEEGRWLMPRVRTTKCTAETLFARFSIFTVSNN